MNINLASILQGSMKILNVVNKTLPLVKEFNPTFTKIMGKMHASKNPIILNNKKNTRVNNIPRVNNVVNNRNNTLTFFK